MTWLTWRQCRYESALAAGLLAALAILLLISGLHAASVWHSALTSCTKNATCADLASSSLSLANPIVAGLVIIWLGLAIRVWAIVVLGRAFRTTVEVDADQAVVSRGPYRWVRHPSYTGLLLIAAGFGLAFSNWPGLAICLVLPAAAMLRRIQVEESELTRVLGDPYRAYRDRTKRLIPGVW